MGKASEFVKEWGALAGPLVAMLAVVATVLGAYSSLGSRIDSTAGDIRGRVDSVNKEVAKLRETVGLDQAKLNQEIIPRLNKLYESKGLPEVQPTPQLSAILEKQQQMLKDIQALDRTLSDLAAQTGQVSREQARVENVALSAAVQGAASDALKPVEFEWEKAWSFQHHEIEGKPAPYSWIPEGAVLRNRPVVFTFVRGDQVAIEGIVPSPAAKVAVTGAIKKVVPAMTIADEKLRTQP